MLSKVIIFFSWLCVLKFTLFTSFSKIIYIVELVSIYELPHTLKLIFMCEPLQTLFSLSYVCLVITYY